MSIVSPIPQTNKLPFTLPFQAKKKDPELLKQKIIDTVHGIFPTYSVLVTDLGSDFRMDINSQTVFTGASINKIPIITTLYYLGQKGDIDLNKEITIQKEDIQDYGTGSIRYDPPGTLYSIRTLAKLMIQQSDNTAAFVLGRYIIGFERLQKIIDSWGLGQTDMEQNTTSNTDMALIMEKLYRGKIVNAALTEEMLTFFKNGMINDRIPALLPTDTTSYHKTGNGVGMLHDVGIVSTSKTTYYIGLFTSNVPKEEDTIHILATLSRIVYEFMNE